MSFQKATYLRQKKSDNKFSYGNKNSSMDKIINNLIASIAESFQKYLLDNFSLQCLLNEKTTKSTQNYLKID